MAIYAIGDIQGCYEDLTRLLDKVNFSPSTDTLWFVGDLVNRGPDSLATLRFIKDLGATAQTVLGNHDLHLLAIYHGLKRNKDSNIQELLNAPDCKELIDWLRTRPLLIHDEQTDFTLVHAGIHPHWTLDQAKAYASELETILSADNYLDFLNHMYGNKPNKWSEDLTGWDRLRFICNSFTRMRYCEPRGQLDFEYNGVPGSQDNNLIPWFDVSGRANENAKIIFGHWSTLGYFQKQNNLIIPANLYPTDTGCVWGGRLTALKIEASKNSDNDWATETISIDCPQRAVP